MRWEYLATEGVSAWLSAGCWLGAICGQRCPTGPRRLHQFLTRGTSQTCVLISTVHKGSLQLQSVMTESYITNAIVGVTSHHVCYSLWVRSTSQVLPALTGD